MYLKVVDRCAAKQRPPPSNVPPYPQWADIVAETRSSGGNEQRKEGRKDV